MKADELKKKCPECGCQDKDISRKRNVEDESSREALYIRHAPSGTLGVIRCSECGHVFEVCEDRDLVKIKKIKLD